MKALVLYATHYGQTRAIALKIADRLREHGVRVDVLDARYEDHLPQPEGYDAVILGSRVEMGRHHGHITGYIRAHRDVLERIPTGFFSVSMAAATPTAGADPNGYLGETFEELGWAPRCAAAFAGALPYRQYGWFMRWIMRRISQSAGHTTDVSRDHVFTDWDEVRDFADEMFGVMPHGASVHAL